MTSRPVGRPMKYDYVLRKLQDEELYSPASIAGFAEVHKLLTPFLDDETDARKAKRRMRLALGRLSNLHQFPDEGDGRVYLFGQAPIPGWYGWRWKELLPGA